MRRRLDASTTRCVDDSRRRRIDAYDSTRVERCRAASGERLGERDARTTLPSARRLG